MPNWVIEDVLATSPRPGFSPGPELTVGVGVVETWVEEALAFGIRSIICLIAGDQLWLYRKAVPEGLIVRYEASGFEVTHIPTMDQQTVPFTEDQYDMAWHGFKTMPKPVLVHCSAGMDRTGRIVRHILDHLSLLGGDESDRFA